MSASGLAVLFVTFAQAPSAAPLAVRFDPASEVKDPAGLSAAIDKPFDEPWKLKVGRNGPERAIASCAQLGLDFPGGTLLTGDPVDQRPLQDILPAGPMRALLLSVPASDAHAAGEDSVPSPLQGDRLITRAGLLAAWRKHATDQPRALLLRTGTDWRDEAPPDEAWEAGEEDEAWH